MKTNDTTQSQVIATMSQLQPIQDYFQSERHKAFERVNELIQQRINQMQTYTEHYY